jgi:hypothetical protein
MFIFNIVDKNTSQDEIICFINALLNNNITNFKIFVKSGDGYTNYSNYLISSNYNDIRNLYEYMHSNYEQIVGIDTNILYFCLTHSMVICKNDIIDIFKKIILMNDVKFLNITINMDDCIYDESDEYLRKKIYNANHFSEEEKKEEEYFTRTNINHIRNVYNNVFNKELTITKFYFSEYGFLLNCYNVIATRDYLESLMNIIAPSNVDAVSIFTEYILFGTLSLIQPILVNFNTDEYHVCQHKNKISCILHEINKISNETEEMSNIMITESIENIHVINTEIPDEITDEITENIYITNYNCDNCIKYNFSNKPHLFTYFCSLECRDITMNIQGKIPG